MIILLHFLHFSDFLLSSLYRSHIMRHSSNSLSLLSLINSLLKSLTGFLIVCFELIISVQIDSHFLNILNDLFFDCLNIVNSLVNHLLSVKMVLNNLQPPGSMLMALKGIASF
ncbi:unnamed protein product [Moneuplotes crassus]|uniref:Uncharacterized protein n=1 Tax=Euplotes crassus TaxID=5936 RepID=A0AAD1Y126_EUPCR|nr:unnamed protein product [Moneuplotes crassus]